MIDFDILKKFGTTNERLKSVFTAELPPNVNELSEEEQTARQKDVELRKRMQTLVTQRLTESVEFNLRNHVLYSAVDLAWDSTPVHRGSYPLMLYAQGKLNVGACATSLTAAGLDKYVKKNAQGQAVDIDMPKFYEVNVNLIRSILTRRHAAQANKYNNFWPHFKYESRSTALTGKLRADIMSQRMDIMADQFDYKHHESQVIRDTLLYGHVIDFIRSAWEQEKQMRKKPQAPGTETQEFETEAYIVKEGLSFLNPHPSRTFWDNSYPLTSLNSDTGCEWVGFWDVVRYKDAANNMQYWNRDKVSYTSGINTLFSTYANYFTQYYTTIKPPTPPGADLTSFNDRKNNIGYYAGEQMDSAMLLANFYWKIIPSEWGLGDYPHPVWTRFLVAGDNTIIFAEFLPSSPAAVCSHNENDGRQVNISFAHELMGYQDQLTNLLSYLLLSLQSDNIKIMVVDTDVATPEQINVFRQKVQGGDVYNGTLVLEVSRSKLEEMKLNPEKVVQLVETKSVALDVIFRAIAQLIALVERLAALSPQEQGQPAPREISATEVNLINGTTESVYGFISDSIDEYRAAKKRICYESYISLGDQNFRLPVVNRYSTKVIEAAGLQPEEGEYDYTDSTGAGRIASYTILGTKEKLCHDYIFTSRDGAERAVNTQASNALVQLLGVILNVPPVLQAMKKDQLFEIVNEIFRQSGAGVDLKLEVQEGEDNSLGPDPNEVINQIQGVLKALTDHTEKNSEEIANLKQVLEPLLKQRPQQPQPQAPGPGPMPMMPMGAATPT